MTDILVCSEEHRTNLRLLADHLLSKPSIDRTFDMSTFAIYRGTELRPHKALEIHGRHPCGTVLCAAGSGLKIDLPQFRPELCETWNDYILRVYGVKVQAIFSTQDSVWNWLFSSVWEYSDNSPHGAAYRILWWLDHGLPENALEQKAGKAPLCYYPEKIS